MIEFKSDQVIGQLKEKGISVYSASSNGDANVYFDSEDYDQFLCLIDELKTSVVFMEVFKLEDYEIESSLIEEYDVRPSYARPVIKKEIDEFNNKIKQLGKFVGKEQSIEIFFFHQGVHYSYQWKESELYPRNKTDFIEELLEQYEEEIEEARGKLSEEHHKSVEEQFERIRQVLINDEQFKLCKNKELRKTYIYKLLREHDELKDISGIPTTMLMLPVEEAWRELKLQTIF